MPVVTMSFLFVLSLQPTHMVTVFCRTRGGFSLLGGGHQHVTRRLGTRLGVDIVKRSRTTATPRVESAATTGVFGRLLASFLIFRFTHSPLRLGPYIRSEYDGY